MGETINNNDRDLVIIDRSKIRDSKGVIYKSYKYRCNKCGFECGSHFNTKDEEFREELWIRESSLKNGNGCSCCCKSPRIVVEHINSIKAKYPEWIEKYGISEYDAITHAPSSGKKINVICGNCNKGKLISIDKIYNNNSISCNCGDGISYPEKFMESVLKQLKVEYKTQLNKSTFEWCGDKRYDFYLPEYNCIIETHGIQHYIQSNRGVSILEEQANDLYKYNLAIANNINNYIIIDCRKSDMEWIKNSILNSYLDNMFNLSLIDWDKAEKYALSSKVWEVCEYWNYKEGWKTTTNLAYYFGLCSSTINKYLKIGVKHGWCDYDAKEERRKVVSKNGKSTGKQVEVFKGEQSIGIFESAKELERISEELFGIKLSQGKISLVCLGKQKHHKGFTFKYV